MGIFIEHFASRQEFEEWLAAVGDRVRIRNVSMATGRPGAAGAGTSYTVTYEAESQLDRSRCDRR
ncbi:MAG TPA: hypothetical protein VMT17_06605 [Anaeromyxobacteraceae bacterium]|nr:hypothetical protein [Anaeromyxobacteraceae bacterium]